MAHSSPSSSSSYEFWWANARAYDEDPSQFLGWQAVPAQEYRWIAARRGSRVIFAGQILLRKKKGAHGA